MFSNTTIVQENHRLEEMTLVHADETPIVTRGKRGYVWVFCNFDDVVYFYSESREAETIEGSLMPLSAP